MYTDGLIPLLMAQLAFWMVITGLAIRENRALKRRVAELTKERK